jgi:hypothetical protein
MLYDRAQGGYEDDEEFAARYVHSITGQDTIEGPSMEAGLRTGLAFFGDTAEERKAVFEKMRPEGQLMEIPGTDIMVFRETQQEDFRKVDQALIESMAKGTFLRETGRDLAEFAAGEGTEAAVETLMLLFGKAKVPGAGRATKNILRVMVGNLVGGGLQEAAQVARGTARERADELAGRKAGEAIGTGVGAAVGGLIAGTFSRLSRRSQGALVGAVPGAEEAIAGAERMLPKTPRDPRWYHFGRPKEDQMQIPLNYLTDQPLVQRVGRIASAIMPHLNRYLIKLDKQVKVAARAMVNKDARDAFMSRSLQEMEKSASEIVEFTRSAVKYKSGNIRTQGLTIQSKIKEWWKKTGEQGGRLYNVARSIEEPDFDLTPALKDAEDILAMKLTPGKPITVGAGDDAEEIVPLIKFGRAPSDRLRDFIKRFKAIDEDLPDPDLPEGVPITIKTDLIRAMIQ